MNTKKRSSRSGDTAGRRSSSSGRSNNNGGTAAASTATDPTERKEIERNRRLHMKSLCMKLASLIPEEHCSSKSKDAMTQLGSLDEATAYIQKLKARVEELQRKKSSALLLLSNNKIRGDDDDAAVVRTSSSGGTGTATATPGSSPSEEAGEEAAAGTELEEPAAVVDVQHSHDGSSMEVVLISSVRRPFKLHQVVTVLEEEGAEIISANLSVVDGGRMFHTIHCRAFSSRIGIEFSRVRQRLRAMVLY